MLVVEVAMQNLSGYNTTRSRTARVDWTDSDPEYANEGNEKTTIAGRYVELFTNLAFV